MAEESSPTNDKDEVGKFLDENVAAAENAEAAKRRQQAEAELDGIIARIDERLGEDPDGRSLYLDTALLGDLASLKVNDPAEYAVVREHIKGRTGLSIKAFEDALQPEIDQLRQEQQPNPDDEPGLAPPAQYEVIDGQICQRVVQKGILLYVPLCNFSANIVEVVIRDDGAEQRRSFVMHGELDDGTELLQIAVPAEQYSAMVWVSTFWGPAAIVFAGRQTADNLRAAIQVLSTQIKTRMIYEHTGWRRIDDRDYFLHAGGAIGANGMRTDIEVQLPGALSLCRLPEPSRSKLPDLFKRYLLLFEVAPDRISVPLAIAPIRAALGNVCMSLLLTGPTGTGKTQLAALAQQHIGPELDAQHLAASWASTDNALEGTAFQAKDMPLVVDDFAPHGTSIDVSRQHAKADRILRGQANAQGRARMRPDGTLRPTKSPRGMIVSTGEDRPRGQSLQARCLICDVGPEDVNFDILTECQQAARDGVYAQVMACFIQWVAKRGLAWVQERFESHRVAMRDKATTAGMHRRTPSNAAELGAAVLLFVEFLSDVSPTISDSAYELFERGWKALLEACDRQVDDIAAEEPAGLYIRLLRGALAAGQCHLADRNGREPQQSGGGVWGLGALGWWLNPSAPGWQPKGPTLGWIDGDDVYLNPESAFAVAQKMSREHGQSLPCHVSN